MVVRRYVSVDDDEWPHVGMGTVFSTELETVPALQYRDGIEDLPPRIDSEHEILLPVGSFLYVEAIEGPGLGHEIIGSHQVKLLHLKLGLQRDNPPQSP